MTQNQTITKIAIFQKKEIRKIIHKGEWWFSVIDVVETLSGTDRPRKYWNDLKKKLAKEGFLEVSEKIGQLKMLSPDGKMRETNWRLMSDGISYRLGYLNGRLRAYEGEEDRFIG